MQVSSNVGQIPFTSKQILQLHRMSKSNQCHSGAVPGRPSVGGRRAKVALYQCHSNLVSNRACWRGTAPKSAYMHRASDQLRGPPVRWRAARRRLPFAMHPECGRLSGTSGACHHFEAGHPGTPASVQQPTLADGCGQEPNPALNRTHCGRPSFGL